MRDLSLAWLCCCSHSPLSCTYPTHFTQYFVFAYLCIRSAVTFSCTIQSVLSRLLAFTLQKKMLLWHSSKNKCEIWQPLSLSLTHTDVIHSFLRQLHFPQLIFMTVFNANRVVQWIMIKHIGLVTSDVAIFPVTSQILTRCGQEASTSGISGPVSKSKPFGLKH